MLDRLVLRQLPRHAALLDLCCGTGQLAAALCRRGFTVCGLDRSPRMIELARRNAPSATFRVGDARSFRCPERFHAILATGDSLNHLLTAGDLKRALRCARRCLVPGGQLAFDLNSAEAYRTQWRKSFTVSENDSLVYVRGSYDPASRIGTTRITAFRRQGSWKRVDVTLHQRRHLRPEVVAALGESGFSEVRIANAAALGLRGHLSVGRIFVTASNPVPLGTGREK